MWSNAIKIAVFQFTSEYLIKKQKLPKKVALMLTYQTMESINEHAIVFPSSCVFFFILSNPIQMTS